MEDRVRFRQWLIEERIKRGWSQAVFARKAGESRSTLSKIEAGISMPGIRIFMRMAEALELSPMTLFRKAGLLPEATEQQIALDDLEYLLSQLDAEDQEELRMIATIKINRHRKLNSSKGQKTR